MKRTFFLVAVLIGAALAARSLLQGRRLAQIPATMMEHCLQAMPEDAPPKAAMSSLRHVQEQNEQVLALLREQKELLQDRFRTHEPVRVE